jgi:hypothetical protein
VFRIRNERPWIRNQISFALGGCRTVSDVPDRCTFERKNQKVQNMKDPQRMHMVRWLHEFPKKVKF